MRLAWRSGREQGLVAAADHHEGSGIKRVVRRAQQARGGHPHDPGRFPAGEGKAHVAPTGGDNCPGKTDRGHLRAIRHQRDRAGQPAQRRAIDEQAQNRRAHAHVDARFKGFGNVGPMLDDRFERASGVAQIAPHGPAEMKRHILGRRFISDGVFVDQQGLQAEHAGLDGGGDTGRARPDDEQIDTFGNSQRLCGSACGIRGVSHWALSVVA